MRYDTKTSDIIIGKSNGETTTMYNFSNGKLKKIVQTESYSSPRIVAKYDPKDESNYTIKLPSSNIDEEYIDIFSCEFKNDKLISAQERKREYKEDGSSFYRQVKYIF